MTRLLLASASTARLTTLRRAGVTPHVLVSGVDEDATLREAVTSFGSLEPAEQSLILARAKAEAVARLVDQAAESDRTLPSALEGEQPISSQDCAFVLGCDSILEFEDEALGKPGDAATAIARWERMTGKSGVLHTGHWLIDLRDTDEGGTGATMGEIASTVVHFANLDRDEIEAYVATGEPLHAAGAFTIDGLAAPYIRGVEGDPHNVIGLSLPVLRDMLGQLGVPWRLLRS